MEKVSFRIKKSHWNIKGTKKRHNLWRFFSAGKKETKRIGYVASTRAKYLLVWGVPKMNSEDKELLKSYGFVNGEDLI